MHKDHLPHISLPPLRTYVSFFHQHHRVILICTFIGALIGVILSISLPTLYKSQATIISGSIESDKFSSANKKLELFKFYLQNISSKADQNKIYTNNIDEIFKSAYVNKLDNAINIHFLSPDTSTAKSELTNAGNLFLKFLIDRRDIVLNQYSQQLLLGNNQILNIDTTIALIDKRISSSINDKSLDTTNITLFLYKNNLAMERLKIQDSIDRTNYLIKELESNPSYYLIQPTEPVALHGRLKRFGYSLLAGLFLGIFFGLLRQNLNSNTKSHLGVN
jgi:hypothetical protein